MDKTLGAGIKPRRENTTSWRSILYSLVSKALIYRKAVVNILHWTVLGFTNKKPMATNMSLPPEKLIWIARQDHGQQRKVGIFSVLSRDIFRIQIFVLLIDWFHPFRLILGCQAELFWHWFQNNVNHLRDLFRKWFSQE